MNYEVHMPDGFNLEAFSNSASIQGTFPNGTELRRIPIADKSATDATMGFSEVIQVLNANPVFFGLLLTAIVDFLARTLKGQITVRYKDQSGNERVLVGSADEIKKAIAEEA